MSVVPAIPQRTQNNTKAEHLSDHNDLHSHTHDEFEPIGGGSGPLGILGYAQVVANQGGITTETDLTGLSVVVNVGASRRIKITGHIHVASPASHDIMQLNIKESTTVLQSDRVHQGEVAGFQTLHGQIVISPSVGAHTYKLSLLRDTGSGTLTLTAGATLPCFILIEDIGAA